MNECMLAQPIFGNSSRGFTGVLVRALKLIGCPKVAAISADAIALWLQSTRTVDRVAELGSLDRYADFPRTFHERGTDSVAPILLTGMASAI